jgi:hypothetical protein
MLLNLVQKRLGSWSTILHVENVPISLPQDDLPQKSLITNAQLWRDSPTAVGMFRAHPECKGAI